MLATINAVKPKAGTNANAYVIFDYQNPTNFKFAGLNVSTNQLEIGHRNASGWIVDTQTPMPGSVKSDTDYNMFLAFNGTAVTLTVNNQRTLTFTFTPRVDENGVSHGVNHGMVGLGARNAEAQIDNVTVQIVPPVTTLNKTVDFNAGTTTLLSAPLSGTWNVAAGRYEGTAGTNPAIGLTAVRVLSYALLDVSTKLKFSTGGEGGLIFDQYAPDLFKFVTISAGKITLGHRTPKGWFTDQVFNNNSLTAGTDYTLGLTLKGSTLSVSLNGSLVGSRIYNALVTDGGFGLFSRTGTTSFDSVTIKTDDPAVSGTSFALTAADSPAISTDAGADVSGAQLQAVVNQAVRGWLAIAPGAADLLSTVHLVMTNALEGDAIAWNVGDGTILMDTDAGGFGWFIDPTPADNNEFTANSDGTLTADASSPAYGRMDLLTAVAHEIGHLLGYDHSESGVMEAIIDAGERKIDWSAEEPVAPLRRRIHDVVFATDPFDGRKKHTLAEQTPVEWFVEV
jgi:hypothetical protein